MDTRKCRQEKNVRLVGTRDEIFNFILELNPKATNNIESSRAVIVDDFYYNIFPNEYIEGSKDNKVGECDGVIFCGLSQEQKVKYKSDCPKTFLIFCDYDRKTTTAIHCLVKAGKNIDYDLIRNFYEKWILLFCAWKSSEDTNILQILPVDVRDYLLTQSIQVTFKSNLASWSLFKKNQNPPEPVKDLDIHKGLLQGAFGTT